MKFLYQTTTDEIGPEIQDYYAENKQDALEQLKDDIRELASVNPEFETVIDKVNPTWLELQPNRVEMNKAYNTYMTLSKGERNELGEELAGGNLTSLPDDGIDTFKISLSTGRVVAGAYEWESSYGEYLYFRIMED